MTRRVASACAVVLAVLGVLGVPAIAEAAAAPHLTVHLSTKVVTSGDPVTVSARANALCDWIVTFHHERRHTIGRSVRTTFTAPRVDRRTRLNVVVTCVVHTPARPQPSVSASHGSGSNHDDQTVVVRIPAKATVDPPLTVLPTGSTVEPPATNGHHGGLPDTGGPPVWPFTLGLGLVLLGSVLLRVGRGRRDDDVPVVPAVATA